MPTKSDSTELQNALKKYFRIEVSSAPTLYEIIGLTPKSDEAQLAERTKLAIAKLKSIPEADRDAGWQLAAKSVSQCRSVLLDPKLRAGYDAKIANAVAPTPPPAKQTSAPTKATSNSKPPSLPPVPIAANKPSPSNDVSQQVVAVAVIDEPEIKEPEIQSISAKVVSTDGAVPIEKPLPQGDPNAPFDMAAFIACSQNATSIGGDFEPIDSRRANLERLIASTSPPPVNSGLNAPSIPAPPISSQLRVDSVSVAELRKQRRKSQTLSSAILAGGMLIACGGVAGVAYWLVNKTKKQDTIAQRNTPDPVVRFNELRDEKASLDNRPNEKPGLRNPPAENPAPNGEDENKNAMLNELGVGIGNNSNEDLNRPPLGSPNESDASAEKTEQLLMAANQQMENEKAENETGDMTNADTMPPDAIMPDANNTDMNAEDKSTAMPEEREMTPEEIQTLAALLTDARKACLAKDFATFETKIEAAVPMAFDEPLRSKTQRLDQLGQLYKIFYESLDESMKSLRSSETFQFMNAEVSFIEMNDREFVIKNNGQRQAFALNQLPAPLELSLAELTMNAQAGTDNGALAVYCLLSPNKNALIQDKGREYLEKAVASGKVRNDIEEAISDTYP